MNTKKINVSFGNDTKIQKKVTTNMGANDAEYRKKKFNRQKLRMGLIVNDEKK